MSKYIHVELAHILRAREDCDTASKKMTILFCSLFFVFVKCVNGFPSSLDISAKE